MQNGKNRTTKITRRKQNNLRALLADTAPLKDYHSIAADIPIGYTMQPGEYFYFDFQYFHISMQVSLFTYRLTYMATSQQSSRTHTHTHTHTHTQTNIQTYTHTTYARTHTIRTHKDTHSLLHIITTYQMFLQCVSALYNIASYNNKPTK